MAAAIRHRGPDSSGEWVDDSEAIAFGHRRLSIIDLSPGGHQPMVSPSGRYVVVFNGEIFNYRELRKALPLGVRLRGDSDTEVLLAAIDAWGLKAAVQKFIGMFAFALWDRRDRVLHLVRDRVGIKPLYYGWLGHTFVFASELKALRAHPCFDATIDRGAVALYLRHNCIPAPHTIYTRVYKLLPGCILSLRGPEDDQGAPERYWSARDAALNGQANPFVGTEEEATDEVNDLIRDSVRLRLVADVPIGAFLSGGVDSSTVVGVMQELSDRPIRTFSIGSQDAGYDEAGYASAVARHLGTEHTELYVTPEDALTVIPRLPTIFDEPFADSSQIPTLLVSELARRHVTVSLSGDGGDELFGGYNRHIWGKRIWRTIAGVPAPVRHAGSRAIRALSPAAWDRLFRAASPVLPRLMQHRMPGYKLQKFAELLSSRSPQDMYRRLSSHWLAPESVVIEGAEPATALTDPTQYAALDDIAAQMMYLDLVTYLPDDILTKVDRASMSVSLEARVPLLDHRLVEFAWRLPLSMKVKGGHSKWILRQVLYRYVPRPLIERPKTGFGVPLDSWLRGPLRAWAEELLDERRLKQEGFFEPAPIREAWATHLSGKRDLQYDLWDVLMFQAWLEAQTDTSSPSGAADQHEISGTDAAALT